MTPNDQGEFTIDSRSTTPIRALASVVLYSFVVALTRSRASVAVPESETFRMDWRSADSNRLRSSEIAYGCAHVCDGRLTFWVRSRVSPSFFAIATR